MPSVESVVDRAFVELIGKARRRADDEFRRQIPREATVNLGFSGGDLPLVVGLAGGVQIPYACIPTWCHVYAGIGLSPTPVTALVTPYVTSIQAFGAGQLLNGTGAYPQLISTASAEISLAGWMPSLLAQDIILFTLTNFGGAATWLTVSIGIRAIDSDQVANIVDATGDFVIDEFGNTVILRG